MPIGTEMKKVSRHNGRRGKNGVYNPKHNDRSFNVENAENINSGLTQRNLYWDWKNGLRSHSENDGKPTFREIEREFYETQFGAYLNGQHERNRKSGHSKRDRTAEDLLNDSRFCPEETIYQIGREGLCPPPGVLMQVMEAYMNWYESTFGSNIMVLDWAMHLDETSPHVHARQVFFVTNRYGECEPKQEKALEALGIPLPNPNAKPGQLNNRKMKFDEICRDKLIEYCRHFGIAVDSEPVYGGRQYLEKQDYIIESQREKLAELDRAVFETDEQLNEMQQELKGTRCQLSDTSAQVSDAQRTLEEKREELADIDRLTEHLTDIVYNSAVDAVTAQAVREMQEETVRKLQADYEKTIKGNDDFLHRNAQNAFLTRWFKNAKKLITGSVQKVIESVREKFIKPERALELKTKIVEQAKPSLRKVLEQNRHIAAQRQTQPQKRRPSRGGDCL